jgi:hypothetical protein
MDFLTNGENFKDLGIDDEVFQGMLVEQEDNEHDVDKDENYIKPKLHTMLRGIVNLENLFDL